MAAFFFKFKPRTRLNSLSRKTLSLLSSQTLFFQPQIPFLHWQSKRALSRCRSTTQVMVCSAFTTASPSRSSLRLVVDSLPSVFFSVVGCLIQPFLVVVLLFWFGSVHLCGREDRGKAVAMLLKVGAFVFVLLHGLVSQI